LKELYPDAPRRKLTTGKMAALEEAVVSAGYHDKGIDDIEMEIGHEFNDSGLVMGQREWEAMTPEQRTKLCS
jgi:hypothetical protein